MKISGQRDVFSINVDFKVLATTGPGEVRMTIPCPTELVPGGIDYIVSHFNAGLAPGEFQDLFNVNVSENIFNSPDFLDTPAGNYSVHVDGEAPRVGRALVLTLCCSVRGGVRRHDARRSQADRLRLQPVARRCVDQPGPTFAPKAFVANDCDSFEQ